MFTTGCRLSEIVNVRISDINWSERCLKVIGKGDKERFVYFTVKCRILLINYIGTTNMMKVHIVGDVLVQLDFRKFQCNLCCA